MSLIRATNTATGRGLLEETFIGDFGVNDDAAIERSVEGIPSGRTLKDAWLTVKTLPTDTDAAAILQKAITTTPTANGQVSDTGGDGVGSVRFLLTPANTALLSDVKYYDIQVALDNGETYTVERGKIQALRPAINTAIGTRNGRGYIRQVSTEPTTRASQFPQRNEIIDDLVAGDDFAIERSVDGLTGVLTVASARLTARAAPADADPGLFQITITTSPGGGGQILDAGSGVPRAARLRFALTKAQTAQLSTPRGFDVDVTLSDGKIYTVLFGTLYAPVGITIAEGAAGSSLPAGNSSLISNLGGDTPVNAFYDARNNVGVTGAAVDYWDDTRGGAGFAPRISFVGSARPTFNAVSTQIEGDATDDEGTTPPSALFDLGGAKTLYVICAARGASLPRYTAALHNVSPYTGGRRLMAIRESNDVNISGFTYDGTTPAHPDSAVAQGDTIRVIKVSKNATTGLAVEVPNKAAVAATGVDLVAGNNQLTLFNLELGSNGTRSASWIKAVIVLDREGTDTDDNFVRDYAIAQHGAVAAAP